MTMSLTVHATAQASTAPPTHLNLSSTNRSIPCHVTMYTLLHQHVIYAVDSTVDDTVDCSTVLLFSELGCQSTMFSLNRQLSTWLAYVMCAKLPFLITAPYPASILRDIAHVIYHSVQKIHLYPVVPFIWTIQQLCNHNILNCSAALREICI